MIMSPHWRHMITDQAMHMWTTHKLSYILQTPFCWCACVVCTLYSVYTLLKISPRAFMKSGLSWLDAISAKPNLMEEEDKTASELNTRQLRKKSKLTTWP